ncbi:MAG: 3-dehydroquinate synthase [Armatimonadota bacterium]|nr:3-dehydroquinate synthase [Armatimonadota bacterium]
MAIVRVELGERSYDIRIEPGSLRTVGEMAAAACPSKSAGVVTNARIGALYGRAVADSLEAVGIRVSQALIPEGEKYKTLGTCRRLYDAFLAARLDRGSLVVALGGGVIGDIAGFAAATFLRGLPFLQVPTTLLAQVDSSIGGKVGVNLPQGKNLVGAFHQPVGTLIDPLTLRTLPRREARAGLAEVIKHGIIYDQEFFEFLRANIGPILALEEGAITEAISRSCVIKAGVVAADERESGLREILNFGHTIGHGVETAAGYGRYRHGEAVSIGMIAETLIAERSGVAANGVAGDVCEIIRAAGLPTTLAPTVSPESVVSALALDKKARRGRVRFVLPAAIGRVVKKDDIAPELVLDVLREMQSGAART